MPLAANVLQFPFAGNSAGDQYRYDPSTNTAEIETGDGGVIVDFAPNTSGIFGSDRSHGENLAEYLSEDVLNKIAADLIEGIEHDDSTRFGWLQQREKGIDLLGVQVTSSRASAGAAPLSGMADVKHPILLEACLTFHSNAVGELLPAGGPVKVENTGSGGPQDDLLARELERDLNTYLTCTAVEYYPDTDKLLFQVGWSGAGFKKGYHCPLRQRPVIESVDAKDLIVSNDLTDLASAARVTHVISMNNTAFLRMQIAGAYVKFPDTSFSDDDSDQIDRKIGMASGIDVSSKRPEDRNRTIYECYSDYDIPGYEHQGPDGPSGLPLPYKFTIDKTSKRILEVRRNWKEGDESYRKRRTFVMYSFVPMFGFYPYGLLHILGNTTRAVTTAWRVMLDSGMFANFPGFLYAKLGNKQQNNNFIVGPGQGAPVDTAGGDLSKAIMPLPYKEPGAATMQLVENIASAGRRVAGTTEIKVGEGNQQAPVGTTLALIEQATMIISAVHKRLHGAQAQELDLLRELLEEDPEALWRHRKDEVPQERKMLLLRALSDYDLKPMADPNVPSHMHRLMKAMAVKQLQAATPDIYNPRAIDEYCLRQIGVDNPEQFFVPPPPPQQQSDPVQTMAQVEIAKLKVADKKIDTTSRDKALDREARQNIETMKLMEKVASK